MRRHTVTHGARARVHARQAPELAIRRGRLTLDNDVAMALTGRRIGLLTYVQCWRAGYI